MKHIASVFVAVGHKAKVNFYEMIKYQILILQINKVTYVTLFQFFTNMKTNILFMFNKVLERF